MKQLNNFQHLLPRGPWTNLGNHGPFGPRSNSLLSVPRLVAVLPPKGGSHGTVMLSETAVSTNDPAHPPPAA